MLQKFARNGQQLPFSSDRLILPRTVCSDYDEGLYVCTFYHILAENVQLKSEMFTNNVKE